MESGGKWKEEVKSVTDEQDVGDGCEYPKGGNRLAPTMSEDGKNDANNCSDGRSDGSASDHIEGRKTSGVLSRVFGVVVGGL